MPPVVPILVTGCAANILLQKGVPAYDIVAAGRDVIVTGVVAVTWLQPPEAGIV
jgi:hypothetical protein